MKNKQISSEIGLLTVVVIAIVCGWFLVVATAKTAQAPSVENVVVPVNVQRVDKNKVNMCVDKNGTDISNNVSRIAEEIKSKNNCDDAARLAELCALGSTADVLVAGSASGVCMNEFEKSTPTSDLKIELKRLLSMCHEKYKDQQGTMYISFEQFCKLDAIQFVSGFVGKVE